MFNRIQFLGEIMSYSFSQKGSLPIATLVVSVESKEYKITVFHDYKVVCFGDSALPFKEEAIHQNYQVLVDGYISKPGEINTITASTVTVLKREKEQVFVEKIVEKPAPYLLPQEEIMTVEEIDDLIM